MNILVTGCAGFIGFHLTNRLLNEGRTVVGLDNLNNYYDVALKQARLEQLQQHKNFTFYKADLSDNVKIKALFSSTNFDAVVNLAAQAGVRYSIDNPHAYIESNIHGFLNVLEGCRHTKVKHLVFASTSSVYGANTHYPWSEKDNVDHPVALYAATKKANELMAHSYASLFNIPCTGLRFFTVYGPWGRPDMALFKFTKNILAGEPIDVYNNGNMVRDFTYVDDIVEGIVRVMNKPAQPNDQWNSNHPDPATSYAPYRIYNIGSNNPIPLMSYIETLEKVLSKKAILNLMPLQDGDVIKSNADTTLLEKDFDYKPATSVEAGIKSFVEWYLEYYSISRN